MPVWLQISIAVYPILFAMVGLGWRISQRLGRISDYFDPASPIGQAMGTVPQQLKTISDELQSRGATMDNFEMRIQVLERSDA